MKKIFTLVMMVLVAASAMAQQEMNFSFTSICGRYYEAYQVSLDSAAVVEAIGCTAAEASAFVVLPDDTEQTDLLGGTDGWRNAEGAFQSWGSDAYYYVQADFASDPQIYGIGGYPGNTDTPATYTAKYRLKNGENTLDINISLTYKEAPKPLLSELTKVTPACKMTIEQYPRTNTKATDYFLPLKSGATSTGVLKLGIDWNENNIADYIFAKQNIGDMESDTLLLQNDYYYEPIIDAAGNETTTLGAYGSEASATSRIQITDFYTSGDTLYFSIAQVSGACAENETFDIPLYVVDDVNMKYAPINLTFKCIPNPVPEKPYEEMTCVGEETISFTRDISLGYTVTNYEFDAEAIAALMGEGVTTGDLSYKALESDNSTLTDSYTTSATGFWMDMESHPISWNTSVKSYFVDMQDGYFEIGHMPSVFDGGEKTSGVLLLTFGDKYYRFNMDIQIGEEADPDDKTPDESEVVASLSLDYQIVPNSEDYQDEHMSSDEGMVDLDITWISQVLETETPTLYGWIEKTDEETESTYLAYSKAYSCDPQPGFWMIEPEGEYKFNTATVGTWGTNASYGICYSEGVFQFFQYPGQRAVGDVYDSDFFLQNPKNGKMIKVHFTVNYVESYKSLDVAGEVAVPVSNKECENATAEIDYAEIAAALGYDDDEDLFDENDPSDYLMAGKSSTIYVSMDDESYDADHMGFGFDEYGYVTSDPDAIKVYAGFMEGEIWYTVLEDFAEGTEYTAHLAFEHNDLVYKINVVFCDDPSGIESAPQTVRSEELGVRSVTFNLAGQKVDGSYKGIVIKNGKKSLVK